MAAGPGGAAAPCGENVVSEQAVPWRYIAAAQIGTSHIKAGTPCQDSYRCEFVTGKGGEEYLIAIASDGAGSAKHSDEGSAQTCGLFVRALSAYLSAGGEWPIPRDYFVQCVRELQAVFAAMAAEAGTTEREYACTLVLAVTGPGGTAFLQIGDGAIVYASRSMPSNFAAAFWPERGEYANQTTFITSPEALESLQHEFLDEEVDEIAVFTDGIQNLVLDYRQQMAHSPWFDRMFTAVRSLNEPGYSAALSEKLDAFLAGKDVNARTDDDKTLILATRRAPQPAEAKTVPPDEAHDAAG